MNDNFQYDEEKEDSQVQNEDGFDLKELLSQIITSNIIDVQDENENLEDGSRLCENEDISPSTVNEFTKDLNGIFCRYNASKAQVNDVLACLFKHLPGINWPVKRSQNNVVTSNMDAFIDEDKRFLKFDACGNGCCSFIGKALEKAVFCPVCNSPRYYNCSHKSCKDKEYGICNHAGRISKHVFHYRFF